MTDFVSTIRRISHEKVEKYERVAKGRKQVRCISRRTYSRYQLSTLLSCIMLLLQLLLEEEALCGINLRSHYFDILQCQYKFAIF